MSRDARLTRRLALGVLAVFVLGAIAGCAGGFRPASDLPEPGEMAQETTQTSVYYSTGRSLLQEKKLVDATEPYVSTFRELLLALPEENADVAIVQPVAKFNSVTFADGVITVDWTAEILGFEAEPAEKRLALASILATFGQFPEVDRVKFTVEGKTEGEIDGKDIEAFWGEVSLKGQPWAVLRIAKSAPEGTETSGSAEATSSE